MPTSPASGERPKAHFLHVGKNGGSAVRDALLPLAESGDYDLVYHGHTTKLAHVPVGEKFFFVVRDPIDRFVSGYYSRLRRGRPRYTGLRGRWSFGEWVGFRSFPTPERLALGLVSPRRTVRSTARFSMRSIGHVRRHYSWWFGDPDYFRSRHDDLLAVLWLPELDAAFSKLCAILGLPDTPLPHDEVVAHRAPAALDRSLSPAACGALGEWYADDLAFVEGCRRLPSFID